MLKWRSRPFFVVAAIAVFLFLSSCNRGPAEDTRDVSPLQSPIQTPSATVTPPAATAASSEPAPTIAVPEPEEGKGTAVGTIYDDAQGEPYSSQFIYLARVMELEKEDGDGEPALFAELDVQSDPFDQTDEHGRFVIENADPGLYALAVRLPNLRETLLYDADTQTNLSVEIEPGEISDLGTLHIRGPR